MIRRRWLFSYEQLAKESGMQWKQHFNMKKVRSSCSSLNSAESVDLKEMRFWLEVGKEMTGEKACLMEYKKFCSWSEMLEARLLSLCVFVVCDREGGIPDEEAGVCQS